MHRIQINHKYKVNHDRTMEFHIALDARKKYGFDSKLFSITGNVVLSNIYSARLLAEKVNTQRPDNQKVKASSVFAMGLIDEILHFMIALYRERVKKDIFKEILNSIKEELGQEKADNAILTFINYFPGSYILEGKYTPEQYLNEFNESGVANREIILEEMLLLHLANLNPAFNPFIDFFDESKLIQNSSYKKVIVKMVKALKEAPCFDLENGSGPKSIFDILREPALKHPDSLLDQIQYIISHWSIHLADFNLKLLSAVDYVKEENKACFWGPAPTFVQTYDHMEEDIENFTMDKHWMPNVILLAKSAMVWLDQLSKKYKKEVKTLDAIPEEELDIIAGRGFNGLWLIGLWNRSEASRKIKNWCGNPEAEASAYSLYNYQINEGLGGWEALQSLKEKCRKRGIRLASDMVPNHTGIDSDWVRHRPDYFIQTDYPPFPTYTFNSGNLSDDPNIGLYLEDHYYSKEDAAVVFKRVDFRNGSTRYIYHGNDGTMMPWNDTAQINFLNPEAREAVIQEILHVARNFPIIRFDAAMTLAKRHIQRLWFPKPGHGGDIASRSEHAMTDEEFHRLIPQEFWREVVDRIAVEAPDTLLLAEAFWMLEGYFVRSLGMHRVYNSAFMNMLKKEENQKYRDSIKNTILFDPDILKRYVNFMNNPDEDTAVQQFGSGEKYLGICTLMVTLPGLPMFGHGQIEGFHEKYGMEYSKAYWDEEENYGLIQAHEMLICPLMRKRKLFSEVENFNFYDFISGGNVNENVFAYTNNYQGQMTLVLYNNSYHETSGFINHSLQKMIKAPDNRYLDNTKLGDAMNLHYDSEYFCIFKQQKNGLSYIRSSKDIFENGMFFGLGGYETQVFWEVYEVKDTKEGLYARLNHNLGGEGVENVGVELQKLKLGEIYTTNKEFFTRKNLLELAGGKKKKLKSFLEKTDLPEVENKILKKLEKITPILTVIDDEAEKAVMVARTIIIEISKKLDIDIMEEWLLYTILDLTEELKTMLTVSSAESRELKDLLEDSVIQSCMRVNNFNDTLWFSKEHFEKTLNWINREKLLSTAEKARTEKSVLTTREKLEKELAACLKRADKSEYKLKELIKLL